MLGGRASEDGEELAAELAHVRTAMVPQRAAVGDVREGEDLLDAAVAVGRDDEDASWRVLRARGQAEHEVVVELTLGPVGDELVASEALREILEERAEDEVTGKVIDGEHEAILRPPPRVRSSSNRTTASFPRLHDAVPQVRHTGRVHREDALQAHRADAVEQTHAAPDGGRDA